MKTVERRHSYRSVLVYLRRSMRLIRKTLLQFDLGERRSLSDFSRAAVEIIWLTRFYYLFIVYSIAKGLSFSNAYKGSPSDPLWPISLLIELNSAQWLAETAAISVAGSAVAFLAGVSPRVLVWRLGVFLYIFLFVALKNSYGSINHGEHILLYVSFTLLFLPPVDKAERISGRMSHKNVMACVAVFWFTQSLLLFTYSLSGFGKIWKSNFDLLSSDGMVRTLLDRAIDTAEDIPPLLSLVAPHNLLAQLMLIVTVYVQFFALLALFRPHLHRPFGLVLIWFHLGNFWLLNISFSYNILIVGMFVLLSPMAPARFSLSGLVQSLPVIGIPFRAWVRYRSAGDDRRAERAWLVYDGECPLCSNYAQYLRVKQAVGEFVLVNAREGGPLVEEVRNLPHDLNDGMVLKMNGQYYVGDRALHMLALLSEKRGVFSIANRLLFASPLAARLGYPLLKLGRRVLLKLKGVPRIVR